MIHILTILIIVLVFVYFSIFLAKKIIFFRQQRNNLQKRESQFIYNLVAEGKLKPHQAFQMDDFAENPTPQKGVLKMEKTDNELDINEVHSLILEKINGLSEEQLRQLLNYLEEG
ncbi:MAG: hypothetical protein P8012_02750 [Desulfobacterales bacterium]